MRAIFGSMALAGLFWLASSLAGVGMVGYFNAEAFVLVILAPLSVALIVFEWREILAHLGVLVTSVRYAEHKAKSELSHGFQAISEAVRHGQTFEAVRLVEEAPSRVVKTAGLLYLQQFERERLREVFATKAQQELERLRRSEDFFMTLSRLAPAFGLVGTIKGFIDLLSHVSDPEKLGVGMATALTATLYGVGVSYGIFHPLAKLVGTYAKKLTQDYRDAEQSVLLIHDGRHTQHVAMLFDGSRSSRQERVAEGA